MCDEFVDREFGTGWFLDFMGPLFGGTFIIKCCSFIYKAVFTHFIFTLYVSQRSEIDWKEQTKMHYII